MLQVVAQWQNQLEEMVGKLPTSQQAPLTREFLNFDAHRLFRPWEQGGEASSRCWQVGMAMGASGWRETKIDWLPDLSCINYTALLYFFPWSVFGICCISFAVSNVEFRCQKEEEKLHIFFFVLSWLTFHLSCPRLPPRCYGTPKTQCFGGETHFCLHNTTLELPTL